jgi:hypothetical protein
LSVRLDAPVPDLYVGASHSATVTVTIPAATLLNGSYLLACADDQNAVVESGEGKTCIASTTNAIFDAATDAAQTAPR